MQCVLSMDKPAQFQGCAKHIVADRKIVIPYLVPEDINLPFQFFH